MSDDSLLCHDYYPYRAGQYALRGVRNSAETLRAYTLVDAGVSEYITLTVRRIEERSQWPDPVSSNAVIISGCPTRWVSSPVKIKRKTSS